MLKYRLIPCLILKQGRLVQSINFKRYLPIGRPEVAIEFFMNWDVDEITILDIDATRENRKPKFELIEKIAFHCFLPITVGGGISSVEDIRDVLNAGADKIAINHAAVKNPDLITEGAEIFGTQCIVVSIDVKTNPNGNPEVVIDSGTQYTGLEPVAWAVEVERRGAGEILFNSVDKDGCRQGYDLKLIKKIQDAVKIPVVACGGVGKVEHFVEGITKGGAHAVAAANIFQHTEHSTIIAKAAMKKAGIDIRLDTEANYENIEFDEYGRLV